jgi:Caspase domain
MGPSGGNFRPERMVLLQDQRATRAEVLKAMETIKAQADPDDLVLAYFSSHGTPPNEFGGVHMTTYDTVLKPREQVWESSVSDDKLRSFIEGVRAKRLIIILDYCYSNGAFANVPGFVASGSKSFMANANEGYGWSQRAMAERLLGMKNPGREQPSGAKSLSAAPHQWGTILISASGAGELSWESNALRSSVFTHYFLDGLVRTRGSLREAFEHAHPRVLEYVKSEKSAVQTPQLTSKPSPSDISVVQKR